MTTQINIFNEGPADVVVTEVESSEEAVVNIRKTVLFPSQGLQTYVWLNGKKILVEEKEPG